MKKKMLSLLLCLALVIGLLPAGVLSLSAAAAETDAAAVGDYTDPSSPFIADTYYSLMDFFNSARTPGETVYVKLGDDVSYDHYEIGTLKTQGSDVVLDLAGYNITCSDKSNYSFQVIDGDNGTVTITDSGRYDSSSNKWIAGKIDYTYKYPYDDRNTAALTGDIIIKGGTVINRTSSKAIHSAYSNYFYIGEGYSYALGGTLKMDGGYLEAKEPILLGTTMGCSLTGGELNVKGDAGIVVEYRPDALDDARLPDFSRCKMNNMSGKSQILAFAVNLQRVYGSSYNGPDLLSDFSRMFGGKTRAYIDGVEQPSVTEGAQCTLGHVFGPRFESEYEFLPVEVIKKIALTTAQPAAGKKVEYNVYAPANSGYSVQYYNDFKTWHNGVMWSIGDSSLGVNDTNYFVRGTDYTVTASIILTYTKGYVFADKDTLTATVNGAPATLIRVSDSAYLVWYTFSIPAVTKIENLYVSIPEPLAGDRILYEASVDDAGYMVEDFTSMNYESGVLWDHNGSTLHPQDENHFIAGETYTVFISLVLTDDEAYEFAPAMGIDAYVNGASADFNKLDDNNIVVMYTFTAKKKLIDAVTVALPRSIKAGSAIPYSAMTPSGALYDVTSDTYNEWKNGVSWSDENGVIYPGDESVLVGGKTYTVTIMLAPKDKDNYQFADPKNITAKVSGAGATVAKMSGGVISVSYTFTMPGSAAVKVLLGDADGDGEVTILDATTIQRRLAGLPTNAYHEECSDADEDGEVSILDATAIQRHLAGLPTNKNIGTMVEISDK